MSVIDQAFVKAYSRRNQPSSASEPVQQISGTIVSPPDVSINPQSEESAIVWVDAVADQYLRRDEAHRSNPAQARPGTGLPPASGQSNPSGERRTRGYRPAPAHAAHPSPGVDSDLATKRLSTPVEIRQDVGHPIAGPTGIPLVTPGQTIPAAIVKSTKADVNAEPGVDLSQLAILPWIEASSTLLDAPLHHAITGPYYCDSVIVQEHYLPIPVAAVPTPPEPLARPASANQVKEPVAAAAATVAAAIVASPQPIESPQHKPLFSPKVAQPFTAVWEVDAFEFSDTVIALFGDVSLIKSIGFPLDRAVSEGLQTLLITSIEPGSGRTTIATGIAIAAATSGLRVALVDATMATAPASASADKSSLADALNLEVQYGWIEAIRSNISIAETAIHSIEDQLTVLPLVLPMAGLPPTSDEFGRMIETLRQSFDLIVIDGPPCAEAAFRPLVSHHSGSTAIDAAILVQDMRHTSADQANRVMETLRRDGITGLGMVQNFV